jgi:hypothetical protein
LQVVHRLAFVRHERGHIDEAGDLVRGARDRDHATGVRMAHEHDRAVELVDDRPEVGRVGRNPAKGSRRRENRVLVMVEAVVHGTPVRSVSEGTVHENDRWLGHETSFPGR